MPDDETVDSLLAKFAAAKERRASLESDARSIEARIPEIRAALGNPFYYSGQTDKTDQLIDRFTGYKSHEPGLRVLQDFVAACRDVRAIRVRLRQAGVDVR